MDKYQIAHLWAESALGGTHVKPLKKNTGDGSNFFWDGDTIYSYGRHFAIARVLDVPSRKASARRTARKAQKVVFLTRRDYSVTTAQHKSIVRQALRGRDELVFLVNEAGAPLDSEREKKYYTGEARKAFERASRARTYGESILAEALEIVERGNALSAFFGLGWIVPVVKDLVALKSKLAKEGKARTIELTARRKRSIDFCTIQLEKWIQHEELDKVPKNTDDVSQELPTKCRIETREGVRVVITSRRAEVPLEAAKAVLGIVAKVRSSGQPYERGDGERLGVGDFTLDSVGLDGTVKIGCHTFLPDEVERLGKLLA